LLRTHIEPDSRDGKVTKLKILLVCEQPLPSSKRAGRPNYSLKYLSEWRHGLTVVCPRPGEAKPTNESQGANFDYVDVRFEQMSISSRLKVYMAMKRKLKQVLSRERFDVVRSINILPTYAALAARGSSPVYAELTDFLSDLYVQFDMPLKSFVVPYLRSIERKIARSVDYANVETPVGKAYWSQVGLDPRKVAVIPNGVDTTHFLQGGKHRNQIRDALGMRGDKVVAYHGDFGKYDGLEYLLGAMALLSNEEKLVIIGSGPKNYERRLKRLAIQLSLENRVLFTGWIEYQDLPSYLAVADAYAVPIVPITRENRANLHSRIREYLCMGKPFVVTRTEGLQTSLRNIPIYVEDPTDVNQLRDKMKTALSIELDPGKNETMLRIAERLDWKNIVRHDERFMQAIAEGAVEDSSYYDLKWKNWS